MNDFVKQKRIADNQFQNQRVVERMPLSEFMQMKRHPGERDERARAVLVASLLRSGMMADAYHVAAYELDGQLYKLNGHTRALVWASWPPEQQPKFVTCTIFRVTSEREAEELYRHFDNWNSVKGGTDYIRSSLIAHIGFGYADIPILKGGNLTTPVTILSGHGFSKGKAGLSPDVVDETIRTWLPALRQVIDMRLDPKKMRSPMLAAAIMTAAAHRDAVSIFWEDICSGVDPGVRGQPRTALQWLYNDVYARTLRHQWSGFQNMLESLSFSLVCVEAHLSGYHSSSRPTLPRGVSSLSEHVALYRKYALDRMLATDGRARNEPFRKFLSRLKRKKSATVC